jgi:hypothetical protein
LTKNIITIHYVNFSLEHSHIHIDWIRNDKCLKCDMYYAHDYPGDCYSHQILPKPTRYLVEQIKAESIKRFKEVPVVVVKSFNSGLEEFYATT